MSAENLVYVACPTANCGGQWLPADKIKQLRQSHQAFYCPSGHSQWYAQKSEVEKLLEELVKMTAERDRWQRWYNDERQKNRIERRRQYALRGVITKLKKVGS